jgi:3,4-dihydroxy 2-butanone 4-phosphate synthase/GTP cyclohydrolase II
VSAGSARHHDRLAIAHLPGPAPWAAELARGSSVTEITGVWQSTAGGTDEPTPHEAVRVPLPTPYGVFDVRAFERPSGHVYLALSRGELGGDDVLCRLHSECLTGDALTSLRCDCGQQLRLALRTIAAEGRGVLVYATGHEGRGVGLVNKLRCYAEQDRGADTVDANVRLGLPVDARDYSDAGAVLAGLGVRSIQLLTNNPGKVDGLRRAGIAVTSIRPLPTAQHHRNGHYLRTKERRLGHARPAGPRVDEIVAEPLSAAVDVSALVGRVRRRRDRPYVVVKFAQSVDGRIATANGDAKWISGEAERRVSHGMRAASDVVLVGVNTVIIDDPQLTVRMVPGASPRRVVLDSTLRIPATARVLDAGAATTVITTDRSDPRRRAALRRSGIEVDVVARGSRGVDLAAAFSALGDAGTESVLIEGGAGIITSVLAAGLVDRLVVGIAPTVLGAGTEAVGQLGVARVSDGIHLVNRSVHPVGDDVLLAWDVVARRGE